MPILWILALLGCTSGGEETDGSADSDAVVEAPEVAPGEIAIDITIDGETFPIRCDQSGSASAQVGVDMVGTLDLFMAGCGQAATDPKAYLNLVVRDEAIGTGTTALGWVEGTGYDEAMGILTDAEANGYNLALDGDGGTALTGTLQLQDAGTDSGQRVRGSYDFTWEMTGIVEGGGTVRYDPLPGRAVAAFDITLD